MSSTYEGDDKVLSTGVAIAVLHTDDPSQTMDKVPPYGTTDADAAPSQHIQGPPSLGYDMRARRTSLLLNIAFLVFFNVVVPILTFYLLLNFEDTHRHGNNNILYGASTATLGALQLPQFGFRWVMLYRRNGARDTGVLVAPAADAKRRFSWRRFWLCWDWFQTGFLIGIIIGTIALVLGTSLYGDVGYFPLLALFPPIVFGYVGLVLLTTGVLHALHTHLPIAVADTNKGERLRPAFAHIWMDLTALDGGGGADFRHSFAARWNASAPFRRMVVNLNWIAGALLVFQLAPEIILVTLVSDRGVIYAPSFAILLAILAGGSLLCYGYAKRSFRREHEEWAMHLASSAPATS